MKKSIIIFNVDTLEIVARTEYNSKSVATPDVQKMVESVAAREELPVEKFSHMDLDGGILDKNISLQLDSNQQPTIIVEGLQNFKAQKLAELSLACQETILTNFVSSVTGHTYGFTAEDQDNFAQKATRLALDTEGTMTSIPWKTKDAGIVYHTKAEFVSLLDDAEKHKMGALSKYWTLEAKVNAAISLSQINLIKW